MNAIGVLLLATVPCFVHGVRALVRLGGEGEYSWVRSSWLSVLTILQKRMWARMSDSIWAMYSMFFALIDEHERKVKDTEIPPSFNPGMHDASCPR